MATIAAEKRKPGRPRKVLPERVIDSKPASVVHPSACESPGPAQEIRKTPRPGWIRAQVRAEMKRNPIARPFTAWEALAALGVDPGIIEHEGKPVFGIGRA